MLQLFVILMSVKLNLSFPNQRFQMIDECRFHQSEVQLQKRLSLGWIESWPWKFLSNDHDLWWALKAFNRIGRADSRESRKVAGRPKSTEKVARPVYESESFTNRWFAFCALSWAFWGSRPFALVDTIISSDSEPLLEPTDFSSRNNGRNAIIKSFDCLFEGDELLVNARLLWDHFARHWKKTISPPRRAPATW
jgi:hypothetical protein